MLPCCRPAARRIASALWRPPPPPAGRRHGVQLLPAVYGSRCAGRGSERRALICAAAAAGAGAGGGRNAGGARPARDLARSVRAMPIKLVSVSKGSSRAAAAMAEEWVSKLARYTTVEEVRIKPNPKGSSSPAVQKEAEAEKVLRALSPGDRVVLLDERGREATSEDVARLLAAAGDDGAPLCFVVGGPFGHGAAVVRRADDSLRLSQMVLNHQVAYIVLAEQLYRAWTILRGEPYHH